MGCLEGDSAGNGQAGQEALLPPGARHQEHDGGGVGVPVRQLPILLPPGAKCREIIFSPESDGSDAINDDEASSDEKVGELNDSTGADKIEN